MTIVASAGSLGDGVAVGDLHQHIVGHELRALAPDVRPAVCANPGYIFLEICFLDIVARDFL